MRKNDASAIYTLAMPEVVWRDRKRFLGMPLTFTKYSLSTDRIFIKTGFFNVQHEEILLYRVTDLSLKRGFGQRLFGVGTVTVISSDRTMPTLILKNIKKPEMVKELIHRLVEEAKLAYRVRVSEVMGADHEYGVDLDGDGIPDIR